MSKSQTEAPVYEALHSYIADGTPIDQAVFLEFARDGRPLLLELGKSGIALVDRDKGDRFRKLWDFIDKHGRVIPKSYEGFDTTRTHKSPKNIYG